MSLFLMAWGEGDSGGHVLREKTSRGLCGLVCPLRTSERGGEGDCVKEGGGGEGCEGPGGWCKCVFKSRGQKKSLRIPKLFSCGPRSQFKDTCTVVKKS